MNAADDQADVQRVLAGDTEAFERIVRRWQAPLVSLAYRYCRDRGRAEEMAQEVFLRAYRGLAKWRGDAAFSTWLFALAANHYRSEVRRIPAEPLREVRAAVDIQSELEEADRDEAVRRAVLTLPPKYRDSLLLFYFHEMDVPAAARTLDVSEGTLKARLFRGREMLRKKLTHLVSLVAMKVMA